MYKVGSFQGINRTCSHFRVLINKFSSKPNRTSDEGPIKYSSSPASLYRAKTSRTGEYEPRLWYEPYVLMGSFTIFLIYFTILREENDIDQELGTSLYSRISGLEEYQLRASLEYNQQHGLDTNEIIQRLRELEKEKGTSPL